MECRVRDRFVDVDHSDRVDLYGGGVMPSQGSDQNDVRRLDDLNYGPGLWLGIDGENYFSIFQPIDMMMLATLMRGWIGKNSGDSAWLYIRIQPNPDNPEVMNLRLNLSRK